MAARVHHVGGDRADSDEVDVERFAQTERDTMYARQLHESEMAESMGKSTIMGGVRVACLHDTVLLSCGGGGFCSTPCFNPFPPRKPRLPQPNNRPILFLRSGRTTRPPLRW